MGWGEREKEKWVLLRSGFLVKDELFFHEGIEEVIERVAIGEEFELEFGFLVLVVRWRPFGGRKRRERRRSKRSLEGWRRVTSGMDVDGNAKRKTETDPTRSTIVLRKKRRA